jgi:hypothetical protein
VAPNGRYLLAGGIVALTSGAIFMGVVLAGRLADRGLSALGGSPDEAPSPASRRRASRK